jgi:hypothetical protein
MSNVQKYVMIPFDKYEKIKQHISLTNQTADKSQQDLKFSESQGGKGETPVAPPPGIPEKKIVRWLTLPETS